MGQDLPIVEDSQTPKPKESGPIGQSSFLLRIVPATLQTLTSHKNWHSIANQREVHYFLKSFLPWSFTCIQLILWPYIRDFSQEKIYVLVFHWKLSLVYPVFNHLCQKPSFTRTSGNWTRPTRFYDPQLQHFQFAVETSNLTIAELSVQYSPCQAWTCNSYLLSVFYSFNAFDHSKVQHLRSWATFTVSSPQQLCFTKCVTVNLPCVILRII